jgi:hypothetical protein
MVPPGWGAANAQYLGLIRLSARVLTVGENWALRHHKPS